MVTPPSRQALAPKGNAPLRDVAQLSSFVGEVNPTSEMIEPFGFGPPISWRLIFESHQVRQTRQRTNEGRLSGASYSVLKKAKGKELGSFLLGYQSMPAKTLKVYKFMRRTSDAKGAFTAAAEDNFAAALEWDN